MRRLLCLLGVALALISLTTVGAQARDGGCKKGKSGQVVGAVIGGVLGSVLGRKIDGGNNRSTGTILGAALGGLAGSALGKSLDKCEKERLNEATIAALNDNSKPQTWVSDTREGVHGSVTAGDATVLADGRECRMTTRVAYINGEELIENPRLCRKPPQTDWTMA